MQALELSQLLEDISKGRIQGTLTLNNEGLNNEQTIHIASILQSNTTLQTLDLGYNQIVASGAEAIAKWLRHNTTLQTLYLEFNQIEDGLQEKIQQLISNNCKQVISNRNRLIRALITLVRDDANPESTSDLAMLPKEIKLHILSLINFTSVDSIGKTPKQIYHCAKFIFEHIKEFNAELPNSNGFQIKENMNKSLTSEKRFKFVFFKGPKYKPNEGNQEAKKKNIASLEFK